MPSSRPMLLEVAAVLSMMRYEGDVTADGGDFHLVAFEVPTGTVEIQITHTDGSEVTVLDWGVWSPDGFRGWGGGNDEDAIIGVDESSRSYLPGPIMPGTWTVVVGKALLPSGTGHYVIDVVCRDNATLAPRSRAMHDAAPLKAERRWYKGDFHVHSNESGDATATLDQIGALAKQRGIDFVNLSDHNTDSHLALAAAAQPAHPDVLFLRGAEITTYDGHGNAVGLPRYVDHRVGFEGRTITNILDEVTALGALFIVNHPSLDLGNSCIGCAWNHPDTPWDKVSGIEIITGKWETVERLFVPRAIELWDAQLDAGFRIAAVSGSDDHRAGTGTGQNDTPLGSPTTLVLADALSETAIMEAIRAGRTIVQLRGPDDPFVEMTIGDAQIGDDVIGIESANVKASVTGGTGYFVQLWRDGEQIGQVEVTSDAFTHTFSDEPGPMKRRYRLELVDAGGSRIVVTSHIFVEGAEAGGCCDSGGSLAGLAPALLLFLPRRRRPAARAARD